MSTSIELRDDWLPVEPTDLTAEASLKFAIEYRGETYRPEVAAKLGIVLRAPDGALRAQLPYSRDDSEQALFTAWARRQYDLRYDLMDRAQQLERAMAARRAWSRDEFAMSIIGRPLVGIVAQRLVWSSPDGRTMVLDGAHRFVSIDGDPIDPGGLIRLAHPLVDDLAPWRGWLHDHVIHQPFDQIDRTTFDTNSLDHRGRVVMPDSLYDLPQRGWRWGSPTAAHQTELFRSLSTGARIVLSIEPGMSTVRAPARQSHQTLKDVAIDGSTTFAYLSPIARSELQRDLESLETPEPRFGKRTGPRPRGAHLELVDETDELRLSSDFAHLTFRENLWSRLNDIHGLLFDEYEGEEITPDVAASIAGELRELLNTAEPITDDLRAEVLQAAAFVEQAAAAGKSVEVGL